MILVCGEALIDLLIGAPSGQSLPAQAIAGGSPFNVAVGLARLGTETGFLGGLASDGCGAFLAGRLGAEGVDMRLVKHSARPTPVVLVSTGPDGQPSYTVHAHECADTDLELADLPVSLDPGITAIAFGSWTLAVPPIGDTLLALAEREADRLVISIDPNLRIGMVGDLTAWRDRIDRYARAATIIKLSEEDLRDAYGPQANAGDLARRWLAGGVAVVVVTRGAAGATAFHRAGSVHVPGRRVVVVDTVGAGDTFHAALLARLAQTDRLNRDAIGALDAAALRDLLDYATAAAAITCSRKGADLPTRAEVDAFLAPAAAS
jgi:fructokinase